MGWFSKIASVAAPVIGGVLGGPAGAMAGSAVGGLLGGGDQKADTSGMQQAALDSNQLQQKIYEESVARSKPFYEAGVSGLGTLETLLGISGQPSAEGYGSLLQPFGMDQFQTDPGYEFRLGEGEKALNRAMAAQGRSLSPDAVKALQTYGQNLASDEYQNAFNRYQSEQGNIYNKLANIAGFGESSAQQQANLGTNYATNVGNTNISLQNALAGAQQANQANKQSMFNNLAQIGTTAALMFSDRTMKENIVKVGEKNGFNLYEFNYIGDDDRYRGVMAQEVLEILPHAVVKVGDKLAVDYSMIGIVMETVH